MVHGSLRSVEEAAPRPEVESSAMNPKKNRKFGIDSFGTAEHVKVQAVLVAPWHPGKQAIVFPTILNTITIKQDFCLILLVVMGDFFINDIAQIMRLV